MSLVARALRELAAEGWRIDGPRPVFERPERAVFRGDLDGEAVYVKVDTTADRFANELIGLELAAMAGIPSPTAIATVDRPDNRDRDRLRIMVDPAGHPFCLWS